MKIQGWLTKAEGEWLRRRAKECTGPILEIGSYKGLSTSYLANGSLEGHGVQVYAVDHFTDLSDKAYDVFMRNMKQLDLLKCIMVMRMPSKEARAMWDMDVKLNFLFIVGDHTYKGCKNDWDIWTPLVKEGGIIALHDAQGSTNQREEFIKHDARPFPGVARVADEHIKNKADEWGMVDRICWVRKQGGV